MQPKELADLLAYAPSSKTGLKWLVDRRGAVKAGDDAGSVLTYRRDGKSCWQIQVLGKVQLAHRIIWQLVHGAIPGGMQIDHIDGNRLNNRIENLRLVTHTLNMRNKATGKDNQTGVKGVCRTSAGYYQASYNDLSGKQRFKSFSCKRFGADRALELAVSWRAERLAELNLLGAGYTERHMAA